MTRLLRAALIALLVGVTAGTVSAVAVGAPASATTPHCGPCRPVRP